MQRYFTKQLDNENKIATLVDDSYHHIKNVMRSKVNDEIIVCDYQGNCYESVITELNTKDVKVSLGALLPNNELKVKITLAQGLIRRERFEYVLQKASELGVRQIVPVNTKYSIIKLEPKKEKSKVARWNKITQEACEQSHRNVVAEVTSIHNSLKVIDYSKYDHILVAYEKENNSKELSNIFKDEVTNILIIIGPEGGLHKEEINFLSGLPNAFMVGLGKRILRSETASSYLLSVIGYHYEIGDLS